MTIKQFEKTNFGSKDKASYRGNTYDIVSVDFDEKLIGLDLKISGAEPGFISWIRCENIDFLPDGNPLSKQEFNKLKIIDFLDELLGQYMTLNYDVSPVEDDKSHTEFNVIIYNKINDQKLGLTLRFTFPGKPIELLKGQNFLPTDAIDFVMVLFIRLFVEC